MNWLTALPLTAALILPVTVANAYEPAPLTDTEIAKEVIIAGLSILDASQTMQIKNLPHLEEKNPILGKHPSDKKIIAYFTTALLLHVGAVYLLPPAYRSYLQDGTIALEVVVIGRNKSLGMDIKF